MTPVETATLRRHGVTKDIIDELEAAGFTSLTRLANASTPGLIRAGVGEDSARLVARVIDRLTAAA
ncbi:MAG: hypothetical protein HOW97_32965 [Catenulispora sp.]|nr:hypothetical protein [Catenulispora sp.]